MSPGWRGLSGLLLLLLRGLTLQDFWEDSGDLLVEKHLQLLLHFHVETVVYAEICGEAVGGITLVNHNSFHALAADIYVHVELGLTFIRNTLRLFWGSINFEVG